MWPLILVVGGSDWLLATSAMLSPTSHWSKRLIKSSILCKGNMHFEANVHSFENEWLNNIHIHFMENILAWKLQLNLILNKYCTIEANHTMLIQNPLTSMLRVCLQYNKRIEILHSPQWQIFVDIQFSSFLLPIYSSRALVNLVQWKIFFSSPNTDYFDKTLFTTLHLTPCNQKLVILHYLRLKLLMKSDLSEFWS